MCPTWFNVLDCSVKLLEVHDFSASTFAPFGLVCVCFLTLTKVSTSHIILVVKSIEQTNISHSTERTNEILALMDK